VASVVPKPKSRGKSRKRGFPSGLRVAPLGALFARLNIDGKLRSKAASQEFVRDEIWRQGCAAVQTELQTNPSMLQENEWAVLLSACDPGAGDEVTVVQEIDDVERFSFMKKARQRELVADALNILYPVVVNWCKSNFPADVEAYRDLAARCDLRAPESWFPYARLMRRRVIYHGGPTNSGKTYNAIERLKAARPEMGGGVFCGPLRLLALEIYSRLNREGIYTNLLTGQERKEMPFASHVACTVEMVSTEKEYDVAVIDEIQMLADSQRGHSWTRAFLGIRAAELHVCGGMEAAELVRSLCKRVGDTFELREYERKSPLHAADKSLGGDYGNIQSGDCVVAFSKKDLFAIRHEIEKKTAHRCGIVYGQLPPETRTQQASLFNTEGSGYDVLVASDAIGMGLNLNMRRVVFHSTAKAGAGQPTQLSATLLKQIAGRAGRLSSQWDSGEVTCYRDEDMDYMRHTLNSPLEPLQRVGIFPTMPQVSDFFDGMAQVSQREPDISDVMQEFMTLARLDEPYFVCGSNESKTLAAAIAHIPGLSLEQRYELCLAPINTRDRVLLFFMQQYVRSFAEGRAVAVNVRLPPRNYVPHNLDRMNDLCSKFAVLDLYMWLSNKLPGSFVERELAVQQKAYIISLLEAGLRLRVSSPSSGSLDERYYNMKRAIQKQEQEQGKREENNRGAGGKKSVKKGNAGKKARPAATAKQVDPTLYAGSHEVTAVA
jgi:ATP-dependent RNA helicase SUPV3L1/SUV3